MGTFGDKLEAFEEKVPRVADMVMRKIVLDVDTALVLKSPVGDPSQWQNPDAAPPGYVGGRFRGNWMIGFGRVDNTTSENIDKTGEISIGRVESRLGEISFDGVYFITNALLYARPLEDGHSKQAPHGMVRLTVLEFKPIVSAAAAEVKQHG